MTMNKLIDIVKNPSGFDSLDNYAGELPDSDLLVVLTQSRDSDILTESNWACALDELGGEGDNVEIHRFGHWACGWWEALCVRSGSDKEEVGQGIVDALEGYPVLNEEDHSRRETKEADRVWSEVFDVEDRIQHLRDHDGAEFETFADLLRCIRGGWAPFTNDGYYGLI